MHFFAQGCPPLGHFKSLNTWVHKRCTSLFSLSANYQRLCSSCAIKCPRTWSVQNLAHKSAFPGSAQGLLTGSAQASAQVVHSRSFCCAPSTLKKNVEGLLRCMKDLFQQKKSASTMNYNEFTWFFFDPWVCSYNFGGKAVSIALLVSNKWRRNEG